MNSQDIVVTVLSLNDGEIVGRTRLQKVVYLLDCCGADLGLFFTYHHYGPYSFDLTDGWVDAEANGLITVEERLGRHAVAYSVFRTAVPKGEAAGSLGELQPDRCTELLKKMGDVSDITLELAATMVYLRRAAREADVIGELKARKPLKATDRRIGEAEELLGQLGLEANLAV
ncbi:MAG: hypothetical protein OXJ64_20680 [Boseongicola sp.]|nr:hypothetical protein [Boseongicola sp.]